MRYLPLLRQFKHVRRNFRLDSKFENSLTFLLLSADTLLAFLRSIAWNIIRELPLSGIAEVDDPKR